MCDNRLRTFVEKPKVFTLRKILIWVLHTCDRECSVFCYELLSYKPTKCCIFFSYCTDINSLLGQFRKVTCKSTSSVIMTTFAIFFTAPSFMDYCKLLTNYRDMHRWMWLTYKGHGTRGGHSYFKSNGNEALNDKSLYKMAMKH